MSSPESEDRIEQSPDDLMDLSVEELAFKLVTRVRRLRKFQKNNAPKQLLVRERQMIRVAEIAARARVRDLARWIYRELERK